MNNNPDYEVRKASIKKMLDSAKEFKAKKEEIEL